MIRSSIPAELERRFAARTAILGGPKKQSITEADRKRLQARREIEARRELKEAMQ
jgi:hypothetical protein